ncbi:MAG: N-acetyltransferase [Alphaproteobacteria bacterium]|nr:N-acetyltransferase [Alphaproteobacteria bacterium]
MVVENNDETLIGYSACSPVWIDNKDQNWYGLGPICIKPSYQKRGIGHILVKATLKNMENEGAHGIVVVGDPNYYKKFGFIYDSNLTFDNIPLEYFLVYPFLIRFPKVV